MFYQGKQRWEQRRKLIMLHTKKTFGFEREDLWLSTYLLTY